jgi:hypothetical protein
LFFLKTNPRSFSLKASLYEEDMQPVFGVQPGESHESERPHVPVLGGFCGLLTVVMDSYPQHMKNKANFSWLPYRRKAEFWVTSVAIMQN